MGHKALAALVLMMLETLSGHDIGSNHYVNAINNVGSSTGDHGIGKDENTGDANIMARMPLESHFGLWRITWNKREKEGMNMFFRFLSFINGCAIFSEKILDKSNLREDKILSLDMLNLSYLFYR